MDRVSPGAIARFAAPLLAGLVVSCGGGRGAATTGGLPNACGENFVDANCRTVEFGATHEHTYCTSRRTFSPGPERW